MKFPWRRRADEEREHRIKAEGRRDAARMDWVAVEYQAASLRHQKELNGWTDTIYVLFGSKQQKRGDRE